jgi:capsular exopolysaccharide synthesis family protein
VSKIFDSMRQAEEERRRRAAERIASESAPPEAQRAPAEPERAVRAVDVPEGVFRELGMLRNAVEVALAGKKKRTILFTSAMHGEGTTTVASSYASILALEGREKVLVCEMNARRPAFSDVFSTNGEAGITDYFVSRMDLGALIQKSESSELDVLHAGRQDATVIQLHLNAVFPRMLEEALRTYDTVIIDAPPVISAPETPPMASFVDGVVVVVHAGKTKREVVLRAIQSLANFKGRVLGVVLNRKRYYIPGFIYKRI